MIETPGYAEHLVKMSKKLFVLRLVAGGDLARDFDIASRRQRRQQIELLKHKANLRLTQDRTPRIGQLRKIDAIDQDAARGRTRQPPKDVEERRFAAARGSDDADELARRNGKDTSLRAGTSTLPAR